MTVFTWRTFTHSLLFDGTTPQAQIAITLIIDKNPTAADDSDIATVTGLPPVCTVYHDEVGYAVTDGSFEFAADQPGGYRFIIDEVEFY